MLKRAERTVGYDGSAKGHGGKNRDVEGAGISHRPLMNQESNLEFPRHAMAYPMGS